MDSLDFKILEKLLMSGRITWTELALELGLSIPTITERVRKLEDRKIIQGYSANLDYQRLGFAMKALIFVTLSHPQHQENFIKQIDGIHEIIECSHITGDDDYLFKVICRNCEHLDKILHDLKLIPGVVRTKTTVVLSDVKNRAVCIPEVIKKG